MAFKAPGGGSGDMLATTYDPNSLEGQNFGLQAISGTIDLKQTGNTLIYTVPTGKIFYPSDFVFQTVSYDTPNNDASVNVGFTSADFDDFLSGGSVTLGSDVGSLKSNAIGGYINLWSGVDQVTAGTELYLRVTTADTGTAVTMRVLVVGFLIDA